MLYFDFLNSMIKSGDNFFILPTGAIMITAECQELGSCPLLKHGKITQNRTLKNFKKNSNPSIWSDKRLLQGFFRHAESKFGLRFVLTLRLHRFLATF